MSIKSVMPSNHLILCCLFFLPPVVFPSIRVFSNELALFIRCPKYCSFSLSTTPSNEYSGLMSLIDFLGDSEGKVSVYNSGHLGLIPGSGRSPREGNGNPLQYYCLENPMDGGAW